MAYIAPNTTVKILRDVLLAPDYVNTIYFTSTSHQYAYFASKMKYEFTAQSYQRHGRNSIRLAMNEDNLFDCNYMMFQNTSFDNKWFYAFITDVEYVSNNVCEVFYEIDIMQTWFFECTLKPCMIERTHVPVANDTIGANITPESIQLMEYVYDKVSDSTSFDAIYTNNSSVIAVQIVDRDYDSISYRYDGVYSGARLWVHKLVDNLDLQAIRDKLNEYLNKPDAIIGIYMLPVDAFGIDYSYLPADGLLDNSEHGRTWTYASTPLTGNEKFGSYVPRNKKLYTYPYNFYKVINNAGESMTLRYEFGTNNLAGNKVVRVEMGCNICSPVKITVRPYNYKNIVADQVGGEQPLFDQCITLTDFPLCSWSYDYYSTWMAQNSVPMLASMGLSLVNPVGNLMAGGMSADYSSDLNDLGRLQQSIDARHAQTMPWVQRNFDPNRGSDERYFNRIPNDMQSGTSVVKGMARSALPNAVRCLTNMYTASIQADVSKGNPNTGNTDYSLVQSKILGFRTCIPEEQARMIDNYFDKYGYAIGEIQTPVQSVRPIFTYLKTSGCVIAGRCPASVIEQLQAIYNRGITFWVNGDQVGDYSLVSQNR